MSADAPSIMQARNPRHGIAVARSVFAALVALAFPAPGDSLRAAPLTDEVRAGFIKSAEENCFDGQSKQAANKGRKPEQLHAFCHCLADKMSYTMTLEKLLATVGKPFAPTAEGEKLMRAVFDNCWQVNVR